MTVGQRVPAAFAIVVGMFMTGFWLLLYLTGGIPELRTAPIEIGYHLLAELLTAVLLVTAGFGLLRGPQWVARLYPVALGMLLYTVINSAGYYAQRGDFVVVAMFTGLTIVTLTLLIYEIGSTVPSDGRTGERIQNTALEDVDA